MRRSRMLPMRHLSLLLLCACGSDPSPAPLLAERLLPASAHGAPVASALPAAASAPLVSVETLVDFLPNGNLVVMQPAAAWLLDGARWQMREFAPETGISVERAHGSEYAALVVGNKGGWSGRYDALELLSPVDLTTLYRGPGRVVDGAVVLPVLRPNGQAPGPKDPVDDVAVVLEHHGALATLRLPAGRGQKEVSAVRIVDEIAVVTWQVDTKTAADAYALGTGARFGSVAPNATFPISTLVGTRQYYIAHAPPPPPRITSSSSSSAPPPAMAMPEPALEYEEGSPRRALVVRDVRTGAVLRQRSLACKGQLANPTVSRDESTVLVTCQGDAIVLDGPTLREKRRIKSVLPGCDNGFDLSGHIENGGTLVVEGCMGVARLNLATGRYLCGDGDGVMGAPYEPMSDAKFTKPKAPRCSAGSDDVSHQALDSQGKYTYLYEDKVLVGPGGARIQLEPDTSIPVLSPAADRMAYVSETQLVVRSLPSGKLLDLPRK